MACLRIRRQKQAKSQNKRRVKRSSAGASVGFKARRNAKASQQQRVAAACAKMKKQRRQQAGVKISRVIKQKAWRKALAKAKKIKSKTSSESGNQQNNLMKLNAASNIKQA